MAKTLAEALAECRAESLGPSSCADRITPFCGGRGVVMVAGQEPRCVAEGGEPSSRKAAILLKEAQDRIAASSGSGPPWLLIGGVLGAGLLLYLVVR